MLRANQRDPPWDRTQHVQRSIMPLQRDEAISETDCRTTSSLTGMAAVLVLVIVALVVTRKLQVRAIMEECLMTQRPSCELAADRLRVSRLAGRIWGE